MTPDEKENRIALVKTIRANHRRAYSKDYLDIELRIIPCCGTCQFNFNSGKCGGGPEYYKDPTHAYGHVITDAEDLCQNWIASNDAFCKTLARMKSVSAAAPAKRNRPQNSPEKLAIVVSKYRTGEISAKEAAATLGITLDYFYTKACIVSPVARKNCTPDSIPQLSEKIKQYQAGHMSAAQAAKDLGVSTASFYRAVRKKLQAN